MGVHSQELERLVRELFAPDQHQAIRRLARAHPFQTERLVALDESMPGLTFSDAAPGHYDVGDREVFRPLQYLAAWFPVLERQGFGDYATRFMVLMASVHVEALVKRVTGASKLPLGQALRVALAGQRIPPRTLRLARRFTAIYNDAKHEMAHAAGSHLFSRSDAVLAYFAARRLAYSLLPLVALKTDWRAMTAGRKVVNQTANSAHAAQ